MNIKSLLVQVTLLSDPIQNLFIVSHQQKQQNLKLKHGERAFLAYSPVYEIRLGSACSIFHMERLLPFPNYQHNVIIEFYEKMKVITEEKISVQFYHSKFDMGLIDLHLIKYVNLKKERLTNLDLVIKKDEHFFGKYKASGTDKKSQHIFGVTTSISLEENHQIEFVFEEIGFLTNYVGRVKFHWNDLYPPNEQKQLIVQNGNTEVGKLSLVWLDDDEKEELDDEEKEVQHIKRMKSIQQNKLLAQQNALLKLRLLKHRLSVS